MTTTMTFGRIAPPGRTHLPLYAAGRSLRHGRVIRRERYVGTCSRTFYVGDIKPEDVKAKYESGVLNIVLPKEEQKELPTASTVTIE